MSEIFTSQFPRKGARGGQRLSCGNFHEMATWYNELAFTFFDFPGDHFAYHFSQESGRRRKKKGNLL
jgi:hypothetical protein